MTKKKGMLMTATTLRALAAIAGASVRRYTMPESQGTGEGAELNPARLRAVSADHDASAWKAARGMWGPSIRLVALEENAEGECIALWAF